MGGGFSAPPFFLQLIMDDGLSYGIMWHDKQKGDTVNMFKRIIRILSITHIVILVAFLLIMANSSFADAESVRGHGNVNDVLVSVDGEPVTRGDILRRIRSAKGDIDPSKMDPDTWQGIAQTATKSEIIDRLLLKAARSENMEIDPEKLDMSINKARDILGIQNATEQEFKEFVKKKMLIEKYKSKLFENITIKYEEVKEYYEKNKYTLSMPDRVHLELLIMDKKIDADDIFQRIKEGEDFVKVAREDGNNETPSIERHLR